MKYEVDALVEERDRLIDENATLLARVRELEGMIASDHAMKEAHKCMEISRRHMEENELLKTRLAKLEAVLALLGRSDVVTPPSKDYRGCLFFDADVWEQLWAAIRVARGEKTCIECQLEPDKCDEHPKVPPSFTVRSCGECSSIETYSAKNEPDEWGCFHVGDITDPATIHPNCPCLRRGK